MILSHIVAVSENHVIGKNNSLPWHMPDDMNYFKTTTWGHTVIMGRKSYEAEGKALEGRRNIIVTRNINFKIDDGVVVHSIAEALLVAGDAPKEEVFITGGGDIYKETLPIVNRIYLTRIRASFEGDVFYPVLNEKIWKVIKKEDHRKDARNPYDFTYFVYERYSGDASQY